MDSFAELEECLIFDPARVIAKATLKELEASNELISLVIIDEFEDLRKELDSHSAHSPYRITSKLHVRCQHFLLEVRILNVLGNGEQRRNHLLLDFKHATVHERIKARLKENHALLLAKVILLSELFDQ